MMSHGYLILAGPQCGGKTTAKNYLYARYMVSERGPHRDDPLMRRNLVLLQEMRQAVMHKRGIHSGIFIDSDTEREIIRRDLKRMTEILTHPLERVVLDETNLFTLAHARRRGISIEHYIEEYQRRLLALDAAILFLDVPPHISWTRRKPRYEERVAGFPPTQAAVVLTQYRSYLTEIYTELLDLAHRFALPMHFLDASGSTEETLEACAHAFSAFADERQIPLFERF
jgi:hypothetical protein